MTGNNRIAMLVPFFFPAFGGTEVATYNLARHLLNSSCNVTILSLCKENKYFRPENTSAQGISDNVKTPPIIRYASSNIPRIEDFSLRIVKDLNLNSSEYNILHFQGAHRVLSRLLLLKTNRNKITILTTHALQESAVMASKSKYGSITADLFSYSLRSVNHIIALSNADISLLVKMGISSDRISLIPNGLDDSKFQLRKPFVDRNKKLKILCVARFQRNKNYETLIEIIFQLNKTFDIEAYFVGSLANKQYFDELLILIQKNNLSNVIKIGVGLDDHSLVDCYLSCDVFVLLSNLETSPITLLEAMFAGMPIVATNVGGIPEIVQHGVNGYLVSPYNPEQACKFIAYLLKNDGLRHEIGKINKRKAEKYTWKKVAAKTNALYESLSKR